MVNTNKNNKNLGWKHNVSVIDHSNYIDKKSDFV